MYGYKNIKKKEQPKCKMRRTLPQSKPYDCVPKHNVETTSLSYLEKIITKQQRQDFDNYSNYTAATMTKYNHNLAVIICKKQTHQDLVRYLHAACFSPVKSTWVKAISNNNFITWPGLTSQLVTKHLPPLEATVLGHQHKQRQNLQSTKREATKATLTPNIITHEDKSSESITKTMFETIPITTKDSLDDNTGTPAIISQDPDDFCPDLESPNIKTHQAAYMLIDRKQITTAYKDLTGRFPVRSAQGHEYVMIAYHYDANCILGFPVKNRTSTELTKAWEHLQSEFAQAGEAPEVWVLDNEVSGD